MTTIQSQQPSKPDDSQAQARVQRRAGQKAASAETASHAAFSRMFAASSNKLRDSALRAERLAMSAEDTTAARKLPVRDDDEEDESYGGGVQPALAEAAQPEDGQAPAAPADAPAHAPAGARMDIDGEDAPDWLMLASLLPAGGDDGIFEVLLPAGARIGVAVSDMPDGLSYLLMPDDAKLASRLRGNEMELEGYLRRRIRRNVRIAVL